MVTKAKLLIAAAIVAGASLGVYTSANLERVHLSFFTLENLDCYIPTGNPYDVCVDGAPCI